MAGGNSFSAKFIEDAGGNYLWSENTSTEFIPLSLEAVLSRAFKADVWLNVGTAKNISEILGRDNRFRNLKVLKNQEIYNNDLRVCESGGNIYWEKGVVEPHLILKDMIKIIHPEIMQSHDFVYYRKLE
jgi:iron complex transport system substrate-binding protein